MLTFNQLLSRGGIDPDGVRLVRHKDPTGKHAEVFQAALDGHVSFSEYQEIQNTPTVVDAFRNATYLAGFCSEPGTKATLFVGVWKRVGERPVPKADPFGSPTKSNAVAFRTQLVRPFDDYRGRVAIDWDDGARSWVQRADKQDKSILEVRRERSLPPFPGFTRFRQSLDTIEELPWSWAEVLRNARGIYLLVHRKSNQQYVGSAYGETGFFGRWKNYADGHGGNVAMKELGAPASAFDVGVLEVVASDASKDDIFERETIWKHKLGTKTEGLNRN